MPEVVRKISRLRVLVLTALAMSIGIPQAAPASESVVLSRDETPGFQEVGRVQLPADSSDVSAARVASGWLLLDPANRRGYSFTEGIFLGQGNGSNEATIIESFDLDTLRPRRRTVIAGVPIASGFGAEGPGGTTYSGDIVHAVDSNAKRIYLPWSRTSGFMPSPPGPDDQRPVNYVLILDEDQFDTDPGHAFGVFTFVGADQRFSAYGLLGMAVSHHHVASGKPGKLMAVFASLYPAANANVGKASLFAGSTYDHTLVAWDPSAVRTGEAPPPRLMDPAAFPAKPLPSEWQQVLTACSSAPMSSGGSEEAQSLYAKSFQWDFLPTRRAVYVGCQSAPGSGGVDRVMLDEITGMPAPGSNERMVSLGKPLGDVLVDPGGERLYLRSFGGGSTWWAFDATNMRFAGSIAAHLTDVKPMAAGVDPSTGRLYTLTPDTCVPRQGGGELPFRGGIKMAEARLDPVPAQQNVRPDMTYNSWWRIHVDTVTRRVFVRRGVGLETNKLQYPECDLDKRVEAPQEHFYRVFEDRLSLATQPGELDDAPFTTNVAETKGITQASYLGSGTGYGARVLLTGGLAAASNGYSDLGDNRRSPCSRDDRELLAGSVTKVELSDQAATAEAASLDADARTQEVAGNPATRCRPQPSPDDPKPPVATGKCVKTGAGPLSLSADSEELAFDEAYRPARDDNGDDCPDRMGENRYSTRCIGDAEPDPARGPAAQQHKRDGFKATAKCEEERQRATATAEGALGSSLVDSFQADHAQDGVPVEPLRVGRSSSNVTVTRKLGEGITVKVDSIARGVEIPGLGSIGLVRAEATSKATGRDGRAQGEFKRTICDVAIGTVVIPGCLGDEGMLKALVGQLNEAMGGRGEVRLRTPDAELLDGTEHGYLAAVQRDRRQLFSDQTITRDRSLAIPGLEIIFFRGDGGAWGAGRQVIQLAGAQAATSYGIICVFGQSASGKCSNGDDEAMLDGGITTLSGDTIVVTEVQEVPGDAPPASSDKEPTILRLIKKIPQAIAQALRLLFNNPRELGLLAAVWALLFAPCYLGERRRSIRGLTARRAVGGVG